MRSYGQLWEKIVCEENLLAAWHNVRRRRGRSQSVLAFERELATNLESIRHDLVTGKYRHGDYEQFGIVDPKPRTISCANVRDRLVHHALCNIVVPCLERSMIAHSFACRKGLGSHQALALVRKWARSSAERPRYFLKLDIRHYFDSIDHVTLLGLLDRRFRESQVKALLREIVTHPYPNQDPGKGLPIGNLTSQWFANFYLDAFDHLAETGFGRGKVDYVRYMDDMVFLADDKPTLWRIKAAAENWLREQRGLAIKDEATRLAPVTEGIPFLGLMVFEDRWRLKRSRFVRSNRSVRRRLASFRMGEIDERSLRQSLVSSEGAVRWFGFRGVFASSGEAVGSESDRREFKRAPEAEMESGSNRVLRGGSYKQSASDCSSVGSNSNDPSNTNNNNNNFGFRLVITGRNSGTGVPQGSHSGGRIASGPALPLRKTNMPAPTCQSIGFGRFNAGACLLHISTSIISSIVLGGGR